MPILNHTALTARLSTAVLLAAALGAGGCSTSGALRGHGASGHNPLVHEVAGFADRSPAGVAVSSDDRRFLAFPYLDGKPAVSVAELDARGVLKPFPTAGWNAWDGEPGPGALRRLVNAQAVTVAHEKGHDYLWILDAGQTENDGVLPGGPKLVEVSLIDNRVRRIFYLDHARELTERARLTDLRVDPERNVAYVADCGHGAILVVDLESGTARSVLAGYAVTAAEPGVTLRRTMRPDLVAEFDEPAAPADGVAALELSADGRTLYFHARAGRTLYAVPTRALRALGNTDQDIAAQVANLGRTGSGVDGIALNPVTGDLYLTTVERRGVRVRRADGHIEDLVGDDRFRWPDGLAMGPDGTVFVADSARQYRRPFADDSRSVKPGRLMAFNPAAVDYAHLVAVNERRGNRFLAEARVRADVKAWAVAGAPAAPTKPRPEPDRAFTVDGVAVGNGAETQEKRVAAARFVAHAARARARQVERAVVDAEVAADAARTAQRGEAVLLAWQLEQLADVETRAAATTHDEELDALMPIVEEARRRVSAGIARADKAREQVAVQDALVVERLAALDNARAEQTRAVTALDAAAWGEGPAALADVPTD